MIRDFSEQAKADFRSLVQQVENEKICNFTDWLGDRIYDFEEFTGILKLEEDLSNVADYHKKIIDKNNTTLERLERIFSDVQDVESGYCSSLNDILASCRAFNNLTLKLAEVISPKGGRITTGRVNACLKTPCEEYMKFVTCYSNWQFLLDELLKKYVSQATITNADKNEFIATFERFNPELRNKLNNLISKLSPEDQREVKFYIYSAEEPYRSIYLNELESYNVGNTSGRDTGYFSPVTNTINVDMREEPDNPRGPYTTYFHESGHAIDYNYNDDGNYYSITYRNAEGLSLQDVVYNDVRNNLMETISFYTSDPDTQQHLLDYIMGAGQVRKNTLSKTEKKLLKELKAYYHDDMAGAVNESCSDIYGGVTGNIIIGDYGHWNSSYWYDSDGNPTYSQSVEIFAEYYSYCMTGNEESMASFAEHFPEAKKFLDEMVMSMQ